MEGSIFVGAAVVKWLRDEMRLVKTAAETEEYALKVKDTNGVYIVPAFVGLGAPYWQSDCTGLVTGLTRGAKREHFIRAALESIAYQVQDVMQSMKSDCGIEVNSLNVDGGASANGFLMQFQADISETDVIRPKVIETTALGAAYLAGLNTGFWRDIDDIRDNKETEKIFTPDMSAERREKLLEGWRFAVKQTLCK